MSRITTLCVALMLSSSATVLAQENEELQQLLQILEEETEIATKTRLNADYVPGMVTVLHGEQIARQGVRTLWEALTLVPGIDTVQDHGGGLGLTVRGVQWTYASGNVKLMLNGVSLNSTYTGTNRAILQMPVEQIDRIEVIRGPGSAVHGEYAYAGVVNVITRGGENGLYVSAASYETYGTGALASYIDEGRDLSLSLNVAGWDSSGQDSDVAHDFSSQLGWPTHAPGKANEEAEFRSALLNLEYGDNQLKLQWLKEGSGDYYGSNYDVPPDPDTIVAWAETQQVEFSRKFSIGRVEGRAFLDLERLSSKREGIYLWADDSSGQLEDVLGRSRYEETKELAGVDLTHSGEQHNLTLRLQASHAEVQDNYSAFTMDPSTWLWTPTYNEFPALVAEGTERHLTSVTLQDEYRWREDMSLTTGLRYDDYSDVGSSLTPRLALVWRKDKENIFKLQYGRAFRPPTFYELGGASSGNITPALIDTLEAGYIYRSANALARVTVFRSRLSDFIRFESNPYGFANVEQQLSEGVELEFEREVGARLKVSGNISYLHTYDDQSDAPIPGSSNWMGNLHLDYELAPMTLLDMRLHYVGELYREPGDPRSKLDANQSIDIAVNWLDLWQKGLDVGVGVTNLFDEDNRYPSSLDSTLDDYARQQRSLWARASYHF